MREPEDSAELRTALLRFQQAPGRYNTQRREPALLFARLPAVMQLAIGRHAVASPAELQQAALFFVRTALLERPRDHYALLGLAPDASAAAVKERYRLLMRLVHPDFAGSAPWAAGAAARLNTAYAVLSSAVQRTQYDRELAQASPLRAPVQPSPRPRPRPRRAVVTTRRSRWHAIRTGRVRRENVAVLAALLGLLGVGGGAFLFTERSVPMELVRRPLAPGATAWDPTRPVSGSGSGGETGSAAQAQPMAALTAPRAESIPAAVAAPSPRVVPMQAAAPGHAPSSPPASLMPVATATPASTSAQARSEPTAAVTSARVEAPAAPALPATTPPAIAPPVASPAAAPAAPTLTDVQPQLAALLQAIESGRSEAVLALVDRSGRQAGATQSLLTQLDRAVNGRATSVQAVQFLAAKVDGRLVVTGRMVLETRGFLSAGKPQAFALRAHFDLRDGAPVLTGLAVVDGS